MSQTVLEILPLPEQSTTLDINPVGAFAPGQIRALVERIQKDARAQAAPLDISSPEGRKAIASLARKVSRSKTAIDDAGKQLNESKRAEIAVVDADRRFARETLDELRDEVRKPLNDWEKADEDRIEAHKAALTEIVLLPVMPPGTSSEHIAGLIARLRTNQPRDWQEFAVPAERATTEALECLHAAYDIAIGREQNAAAERQRKADEAERLKQAAAQRQKEREAQIAADAAREAEGKAAQAQAARVLAEARVEQERVGAHVRAMTALHGMIDDACALGISSELIRHTTKIFEGMAEHTRDWQEYQDQYRALVTEGRTAITQRLAEVEAKEQTERDRIVAQREEITRQAELAKAERERPADAGEQPRPHAPHRQRLAREAMEALIAVGLSRRAAMTAIKAIDAGSIPHVSMNYRD